jgi:hypothetical protein
MCYKINIDRQATLGHLKERFETTTNMPLNSYFLFEITRHDISRNLGKLLEAKSLKDLNIKASLDIYAFSRIPHQS